MRALTVLAWAAVTPVAGSAGALMGLDPLSEVPSVDDGLEPPSGAGGVGGAEGGLAAGTGGVGAEPELELEVDPDGAGLVAPPGAVLVSLAPNAAGMYMIAFEAAFCAPLWKSRKAAGIAASTRAVSSFQCAFA